MRSYTAEFDYFSVQEDGSLVKAGQWTDSVEVNEERILRTVTRKTLGGEVDMVRAVAAHGRSLAPLYLTQRFGEDLTGVYHSQVQDDQLTQVLIADNKTPARIMSAQLPPDVVEVNLQGIMAAALPLGAQQQITVAGYSGGETPAGAALLFDVQGRETIALTGRTVSAWKVHQPQSDWTYWVSKEFPYLLKVSHPSPDGGTLVSLLVRYRD